MDDKKIEEAANKHIETEYARYNSGEVEEEMICLRGKDSFKAGAKWAINELIKSLWHPASEKPEKNHSVLFKTAGNSFETEYIGKNDWATIVRCFKVVKWFYVDDLLTKEGGEK